MNQCQIAIRQDQRFDLDRERLLRFHRVGNRGKIAEMILRPQLLPAIPPGGANRAVDRRQHLPRRLPLHQAGKAGMNYTGKIVMPKTKLMH
jgi:hypothetical protein